MFIPPVAFRPSADALLSAGDHRQGRRRRRRRRRTGEQLEEEKLGRRQEWWRAVQFSGELVRNWGG